MQNGRNGAAGDRLREAQRQWELWRLRGRRPGRIPKELWLLAAEAAAEQGVESTARKLRLNSERLEQWLGWLPASRRLVGLAGTTRVGCPFVSRFAGLGHHVLEEGSQFPQMLSSGRMKDHRFAPPHAGDLPHPELPPLQPSPHLRRAQPDIQPLALGCWSSLPSRQRVPHGCRPILAAWGA